MRYLVFLLVFISVIGSTYAGGIEITDASLSNDTFDITKTGHIMLNATLKNTEINSTAVTVFVYDGDKKIKEASSVLPGNTTNTTTVTFELAKDNFDSICGSHEITINATNSTSYLERTVTLTGDSFGVDITPRYVGVNDEVIIKVSNTTGEGMKNVEVEIKNEDTNATLSGKTDAEGEVIFSLSNIPDTVQTGPYTLTVKKSDTGYCSYAKKGAFSVAQHLVITSVEPQNPHVGEEVKIVVVDEKKKPVENAYIIPDDIPIPFGIRSIKTDSFGAARFIPPAEGKYFLHFEKEGYVKSNAFVINVSAKPPMEISLSHSSAKVGDTITLSVSRENNPIASALVRIRKPNAVVDDIGQTSYEGKIAYIPPDFGVYEVTVSKDADTASIFFQVQNTFAVSIAPEGLIMVGDMVSVTVTDYKNQYVPEATINVYGPSESALSTDEKGSASFIPAKPGGYTVQVSKSNFMSSNNSIEVAEGVINIILNATVIEFGEGVSIDIKDYHGSRVDNCSVSCTDANNKSVAVPLLNFKPNKTGDYTIKAAKPGYKSGEAVLTVKPCMIKIDVSKTIEHDKIMLYATSSGNPVAGVSLDVVTPKGAANLATGESGRAYIDIDEEGEYRITASKENYVINGNEIHEIKITLSKEYDYFSGIVMCLVISLVAAILIYLNHRRR